MPPYSYRHGAPCWLELTTSNKEGALTFYKELLGWDFIDAGEETHHYMLAHKNGEQIAGIMAKEAEMSDVPDAWTVYFGADDAAEHVATAKNLGANVMVDVLDVVDLGKMAILQGPDESVYGIWQPGQHRGFTIFGESGAPAWFENQTKDYDAAVAFYPKVTGTGEVPMPDGAMPDDPDVEAEEFKYFTGGIEGDSVYGICDTSAFTPAEVPSHWEVYWLVENTDDATATIERLGGTIVSPASDSFFGRFAIVTDPTGAIFRVIQPQDQQG